MEGDALYLARTVCVRPHHDGGSKYEIAWGEGSERQSFVTDSPILASALATAPVKTLLADEVDRLSALLGISCAEAEQLVGGLRDHGLYSADPCDLTAAEERWLDVAWPDALDLHLATHDAMWVHDYSGNPKVMTRHFVDRRIEPETAPPQRAPVPEGEAIVLPEPTGLTEAFDRVQSRRRTTREFRGTAINLTEVATILDWSFAPRWPLDNPTFHSSQTYSRGAPFVAFALFAGDGAPVEVRKDFAAYQYDPVEKSLVYRGSAEVDQWSELLWQQDYADGAPMVLVICVDWAQYMWKYRTSRAYRWAYMECGAFMQTALTVATGLGLRTFQTPAIDDRAFCGLLGVNDIDVAPLYMAAFGRRVDSA
jgi:hypothetical protein